MTSLKDIRKRLHATENIKEITKAMEMVAASRLQRAQDRREHANLYEVKMREILQKVVNADSELKHPLVTPRPVKKVGVVIITADGVFADLIIATSSWLQSACSKTMISNP